MSEYTDAYLRFLAQKELDRFYRSSKKDGYQLTPIKEFGDPEQELRDLFLKKLKGTMTKGKCPETEEDGKRNRKFKDYMENLWETAKDGFQNAVGSAMDFIDCIFGGYVRVEDPVGCGYSFLSIEEIRERGQEVSQRIKDLKGECQRGEITKEEFKAMKKELADSVFSV